jgi:DNA-3-methyladenine glycosylase I
LTRAKAFRTLSGKTAHNESAIDMPKQKPAISPLHNLGPTSTRWLNAIGVHTRRDLEKLGAVDAYAILKANGYNASLNLVYAIEGALRDCDWKKLPVKRKAQLNAAAADAVKPRCAWPANDPHMVRYHDDEWGVPVHNDRKHFEFLTLEGAQAGLSWRTVLHKRAAYRAAFANFDPRRVARFDARRVKTLLKDEGIIRNRLKIESTITNARAFLAVQKKFGSFDRYVWQFVGGRPIVNHWTTLREIPARTPESDALSADLKKRGFRFVGSTIVYAHMQATGMVNDHISGCFRHRTLARQR